MTANNPQVPWTDEQWARVNQVIQDEAHRARVAATFLPLVGPLPPSADFVRKDLITYPEFPPVKGERIVIDDTHTMRLATLQVKVYLRGAQMADPDLTSAISMFRRAANVLARVEDAIVFGGQSGERVRDLPRARPRTAGRLRGPGWRAAPGAAAQRPISSSTRTGGFHLGHRGEPR
jgi:uncharacterized linocin/CFP29 family protein